MKKKTAKKKTRQAVADSSAPDVVMQDGKLYGRTKLIVAKSVGINRNTLNAWQNDGAPTSPVSAVTRNNRPYYPITDLIVWARNSKWGVSLDEIDNPAISSPMLEKLREEKWRRERIKRELEEGEVMPMEMAEAGLTVISDRIRNFGLFLQRQFGAEGEMAHKDLIDDIERHISDEFAAIEKRHQETQGGTRIEDRSGETSVSSQDRGADVRTNDSKRKTGSASKRKTKAKT